MMTNVGIDTALGSIPLVGDAFDFAWKSNVKNLELYRSAMQGQRKEAKDWGFLALVFLILVALLSVPILLGVLAFRALF